MTKMNYPFTERVFRALKVGDEVLISGGGLTRRGSVHTLKPLVILLTLLVAVLVRAQLPTASLKVARIDPRGWRHCT